MIEVQDSWEVLAKSNVQQCKRCGQCSGTGGHCAAKQTTQPLTPGQQAIADSLMSEIKPFNASLMPRP
ncbi:hypothetical protein D3C75_1179380 [compost metagenome]